jgi:hypothetical protein
MTDQIRFLEPRRDNGIFWISADRVQNPPARTITQLKRRSNVNVMPVIGTTFEQPAPSKHRSRRIWKKLRPQTAKALYGEPVVISFNSERLRMIQEMMA